MKKIIILMVSLFVLSACKTTLQPFAKIRQEYNTARQKAEAKEKSVILNRFPECKSLSRSGIDVIKACGKEKESLLVITKAEIKKLNKHVNSLDANAKHNYISSLNTYKRYAYLMNTSSAFRIEYFSNDETEVNYNGFYSVLDTKQKEYVRKSKEDYKIRHAIKRNIYRQENLNKKLEYARLKKINSNERIAERKAAIILALNLCVNEGFLTPSSLNVDHFLNRPDAKLSYKLYFFQYQFAETQKKINLINEAVYVDVIEKNKNFMKYSKDRKKAQYFCSEFLNKATNGKVAINDIVEANKIKKSIAASKFAIKNKTAKRKSDLQRVKTLDTLIAKQKKIIKKHTPVYNYSRISKAYGDGLFLATQNNGRSFFLIEDNSGTITKAATYKFTDLIDTNQKTTMVDDDGFESKLRVYNISNKKVIAFEKWKRGEGKTIINSLEKNQVERNKLVTYLNKTRR